MKGVRHEQDWTSGLKKDLAWHNVIIAVVVAPRLRDDSHVVDARARAEERARLGGDRTDRAGRVGDAGVPRLPIKGANRRLSSLQRPVVLDFEDRGDRCAAGRNEGHDRSLVSDRRSVEMGTRADGEGDRSVQRRTHRKFRGNVDQYGSEHCPSPNMKRRVARQILAFAGTV